MEVRCKRAYERASAEDGRRVLVDRLWPRGVERKFARIDAWEREIAPTTDLRKWFAHEPVRFAEFSRLYREELDAHPERVDALLASAGAGPLTLVYAAKDEVHNHAVVLADVLRNR